MGVTLVEKRKYVRLDYVIPVTINMGSQANRICCQGFCRNIGFGGMGLEINLATLPVDESLFSKGEVLQIEVELPQGKQKVLTEGIIRWKQIDTEQNKLHLGFAYCLTDDSPSRFFLYNFAKCEQKRRSVGKRWFILSVAMLMWLSFWGMQLHFENTHLVNRIDQFNSVRIEMEKTLMSIRSDKVLLNNQLLENQKEKLAVKEDLASLHNKTLYLNAVISEMQEKINDIQNNESSEDIEKIQQDIYDKTSLNKQIQDEISLLEAKLNEKKNDIKFVSTRYKSLSKALDNRFMAKKQLDKELFNLVKRTRVPMANLSKTGYSDFPRGMWVLSKELFKFRPRVEQLLEFCENRNINLIFAQIDVRDSFVPDQFAKFLRQAHQNGILVHAYFDMASPSPERNAKACSGWLASIVAFNKKHISDECFDGINIHFDDSLSSGENNDEAVVYLEMLNKFVTGRDLKKFPLEIGISVPDACGGNKNRISFNGKKVHINIHLIDIADYIAVEKTNSRKAVKKEIAYATKLGKKVFVGHKPIIDKKLYDSRSSGQYIHDMEREIKAMIETYLDKPGFMGVAINRYVDYRQCMEDNTPVYIKSKRTRIISVRPPKIDYRYPMSSGK